ncbi:hypothetical protein SDC9_166372 [bioreactor metagenome]|uniref:Uncharacterized protein n=1 Tax=bioreactor metagenome TaxID=1076179 RepID=A0A645FYL9_9ZZZZ
MAFGQQRVGCRLLIGTARHVDLGQLERHISQIVGDIGSRNGVRIDTQPDAVGAALQVGADGRASDGRIRILMQRPDIPRVHVAVAYGCPTRERLRRGGSQLTNSIIDGVNRLNHDAVNCLET